MFVTCGSVVGEVTGGCGVCHWCEGGIGVVVFDGVRRDRVAGRLLCEDGVRGWCVWLLG